MLDKKNLDLLVVAFLALSIAMYDVTFDLFTELLHLLFEFMHLLFEHVELGVEHLVEHAFHTERHSSQVITFYLLWLMALTGFWQLWRYLPRFYQFIKSLMLASWIRRKTEVTFYWRELSLARKAGLICIALMVVYLSSFFVM